MNKKIQALSDTPREQGKTLLVEERRRLIREMVEASERVTVEELSAHFDISLVTIRNDLNALAEIGALVRTRGERWRIARKRICRSASSRTCIAPRRC